MKPPSLSVQSVVQWLVHGARDAPLSQEVMTELCERLKAADCRCGGSPCSCARCIRRSSAAVSFGGRRQVRSSPTAVSNCSSVDVFRNSPMVHVSETGEAFRRRLADPVARWTIRFCTTCAPRASPITSSRRCVSPAARCTSVVGDAAAGRFYRRGDRSLECLSLR